MSSVETAKEVKEKALAIGAKGVFLVTDGTKEKRFSRPPGKK